MTSPTLERAARALYRADPENYGTEDDMWSSYVAMARAVLMAVREPENHILQAGDAGAAEFARDVDEYASPAMVCGAFTAMIDAILNDGEGE